MHYETLDPKNQRVSDRKPNLSLSVCVLTRPPK